MSVHDRPEHPDHEMLAALKRLGFFERDARYTAMTGGVSSDIWKVETTRDVFCVKRALPRLKVAARWCAPVERNRFEAVWYGLANQAVPGSAPRVLAVDEAALLFAMEYLDPVAHVLWKHALRDGAVDPLQAAAVGERLARIHAVAAADTRWRERFPRRDIFRVIRLEPYLEATAERHPDVRNQLLALSRITAATRRTVIHGDVSPKNILLGPAGPVFLDAECACVGDPAFDMAFCVNHLLLKCCWRPQWRERFLSAFTAFTTAYLGGVDWEPRDALEERAAHLLPGLFLARVDGKSPVEYLTDESDKNRVRRCARCLLRAPPARLDDVRDAWRQELAG